MKYILIPQKNSVKSQVIGESFKLSFMKDSCYIYLLLLIWEVHLLMIMDFVHFEGYFYILQAGKL